jgi:autotransporter-associated beta strand protein
MTLLLNVQVSAQVDTWDGGGANNFWNNSSNWAGDPATLGFTSNPTPNTNGVVFSALSSLQSSNRLGQSAYINTLLFSNITSDFIINNVNTNNQVISLFFRGEAPRISVSSGVSNAVRFIGGPVETGNNFTIDHDGTGLLTFAGLRSTAAGGTNGVVTKLGSGTMVLSGINNNFNGGLFIQGGAVRSSANAAGNYGYMFGSNSSGNAVVTLQGGGLELYRSGNSTFSNNVVVQSNSTITSGRNALGAGLTYTFDGSLSVGAQTLTINAANVNSGTAGVEFLGATTLTGNATMLVTNNVDGVATSLRLGAVNESGGSYGLTKSGNGLLTLTAANTYSGATVVSAGSLIIGAAGSVGNSSVLDVASGATLDVSAVTGGFVVGIGQTLRGNGTVVGNTTINGTLQPGNSPGLLSFNNALTLGTTAATTMEINGAGVRGTAYDAINVGGLLAYDGTLTLSIGMTFSVGSYSFDLFDFDSTSGSFDTVTLGGLYSGSLVNNSGVWGLTSGNDTWTFTESSGILELGVVPESSTYALLAFAGLGLAGHVIRRRYRTRG